MKLLKHGRQCEVGVDSIGIEFHHESSGGCGDNLVSGCAEADVFLVFDDFDMRIFLSKKSGCLVVASVIDDDPFRILILRDEEEIGRSDVLKYDFRAV